MNITTVSPKKYEELPEQTKQDMADLTRKLRSMRDKPYEFKRTLYTAMTYMYNLGMSAMAEGSVVVEEGRCIPIDKGQKWEIACPYCHEMFDINLEAMLPQDTEEMAVKL